MYAALLLDRHQLLHQVTGHPLHLIIAAPHYSADGELIFSGGDLAQGGVLSYYHDLIYLCLIAQLLSIFTKWGWLVLLAVRRAGGAERLA